MFKNHLFNFITIKLIFYIGEASTPDSPNFIAGVVETDALFDGDPQIILNENLNSYKNLVYSYVRRDYSVDIVVFPESTLNSEVTPVLVPRAIRGIVLCNRYNSDIISQLSCLAIDYRFYLVVNLIEKEICTMESQRQKNDYRPCALDGLNRYSTNVVFDRNGALVSKYRKWNLDDSILINKTRDPEYETFKTDFAVQFVNIICFDTLWWTPTMEFVKRGYKNFVVPLWWFSELPFLTANQIHQSLSYGMNINLLTSAGNFGKEGATGAAAFSGRYGPIVAHMRGTPRKEIIITEVPKSPATRPRHTVADDQIYPHVSAYPQKLLKLKVDRDVTVNTYANILLDPSELKINKKLCYHDFCCKFNIVRRTFPNTRNERHYSYRMVAYSGPRKFTNSPQIMWMKTCAIIACTDDISIKSCARIFDDDVEYSNTHFFENITIIANFNKQEKILIMPNSVDALFRPIPVNGFKLKTIDKGKQIKAIKKLTKPVSDLLTFGILTHYFEGFTYLRNDFRGQNYWGQYYRGQNYRR